MCFQDVFIGQLTSVAYRINGFSLHSRFLNRDKYLNLFSSAKSTPLWPFHDKHAYKMTINQIYVNTYTLADLMLKKINIRYILLADADFTV